MRRRHGVTTAVVAWVVVALLAGCVGEARQSKGSTSSSALPSATATLSGSTPKHGPVRQVRDLLADRSDALLGGDRAGFVEPVDDAARKLLREQRAFYANIRGARLASWKYTVDAETATRHPSKGGDRWEYTVYTSYSLSGLPEQHAVATERIELVERAAGWRIASITEKDQNTEPWDLGKTTSVRGDDIVVLGVGASERRMRQVRRRAADAVPRVDEVWDGDWTRGAVIVVPPDTQAAKELSRTDNIDALAAVATGVSAVDASGDLHRWDRVVVNPRAWKRMSDTGHEVVLAHELTHVATGSLGSVPTWVSEGLADYIGWKDMGVPMREVAPEVAEDARNGNAPHKLPADAEFRSSDPDQAYEEAWLAARYIAFRYGEDKLLAVYREMASRSSTSAADQSRALESTLNVDRSAFQHGWNAYVEARLG